MKKLRINRDYYGLILGELVCFNANSNVEAVLTLLDGRSISVRIIKEKWSLLGMCKLEVELTAGSQSIESDLVIAAKGEQIAMRDQFMQGRNGPLNSPRQLSSFL